MKDYCPNDKHCYCVTVYVENGLGMNAAHQRCCSCGHQRIATEKELAKWLKP